MTDRLAVDRLLRDLHAARVRGELAAICSCFAESASFRIAGASDGKPIAIRARGSAEYRPWLAMMVKTFRLTDYELLSMLVDGACGAVHWRARIHSKVTGAVVATELVDLVEVRDARIITYTEFFTPS